MFHGIANNYANIHVKGSPAERPSYVAGDGRMDF